MRLTFLFLKEKMAFEPSKALSQQISHPKIEKGKDATIMTYYLMAFSGVFATGKAKVKKPS